MANIKELACSKKYDVGGTLTDSTGIDTSRVAALARRINETSNADFVKRLLCENRRVLGNGEGSVSTHELGYVDDGEGNAVLFPQVQSSDYGNLLMRIPFPLSYYRAVQRGDTVHMNTPDAEQFTRGYKIAYPTTFDKYACGGLLRKYENGGPEGTNRRRSQEGGYTTPELDREIVNQSYDPTLGFDPASWLLHLALRNESHGEENEYWRAYLGLDNNVPKMQPAAKTSWDDKVESQKKASGELPSDFYGTTPRMDQMIQVVADTLNTGNILRNYDEYKKQNNKLAPKSVIKHMYEEGKKVMENPGKWTQVTEGPQFYLYKGIDKLTNEMMPLGMLADFGMMWSPDEGALRVHDTYDFPSYVTALSHIPVRPKEMKIRGIVKYDPRKGSVLLRDGLDRSKIAKPVADAYSH